MKYKLFLKQCSSDRYGYNEIIFGISGTYGFLARIEQSIRNINELGTIHEEISYEYHLKGYMAIKKDKRIKIF